MGLEVEKIDGNKMKFNFSGRMDTGQTLLWENDMVGYFNDEEVEYIEFDLAEVTYISSYFIRLCTLAIKTLKAPKNFSVTNSIPEVFNIFAMARLTEQFNVD